MTLIVTICLQEEEHEGLLFSSDSQASLEDVTYPVSKICEILYDETPLALAAGAGDIAMVKKAVDVSVDILGKKAESEWDKKTPTAEQFRDAVVEVEDALIKMFSAYREKGLRFNVGLLLGSLSPDGVASLSSFDDRGVAEAVEDNPGYACIGSGFFLGGNLLLQQFYSSNERPNGKDAADLAAYVINQVSMVDVSVGPFTGQSAYFHMKNDEPQVEFLTKHGLRLIERECEARGKLMKFIWDQSNRLGAKEIQKIIRNAVKKPKKKKGTKKSRKSS